MSEPRAPGASGDLRPAGGDALSWSERALRFARSTPHRTFVIYPAAMLLLSLAASHGRPRFRAAAPALRRYEAKSRESRRANFRWWCLPLLAWGYLQYRLCGEYRRPRAGGGSGMQTLPERIVTTGPYAYTRNPMYMGHIIFLIGLALFSRSRVAFLLAAGVAWWFNQRVEEDERRLERLWGEPYLAYKAAVPRWLHSSRGPARVRLDG